MTRLGTQPLFFAHSVELDAASAPKGEINLGLVPSPSRKINSVLKFGIRYKIILLLIPYRDADSETTTLHFADCAEESFKEEKPALEQKKVLTEPSADNQL